MYRRSERCKLATRVVNLRVEPYDVYIGRPSRWGNPFVIGKDGTRAQVIGKYAEWIQTQPDLLERLPRLKGKRLGCYCFPETCHGDILVGLIDNAE